MTDVTDETTETAPAELDDVQLDGVVMPAETFHRLHGYWHHEGDPAEGTEFVEPERDSSGEPDFADLGGEAAQSVSEAPQAPAEPAPVAESTDAEPCAVCGGEGCLVCKPEGTPLPGGEA